jgi:hypothetical protein
MNAHHLARIASLILLPITLIGQTPRDPIPLTPWPAPLYWQPTRAGIQRLAATNPDASDLTTDATTPANALVFVAMTPCRIIDTRAGGTITGPLGPPSLTGGAARTFPVQSSVTCAIPSIAQAYSFNVTVAPAGFLDYITVWPTGQARPLASTVNGYVGTVIANAAIVPAGTNGSVDVFASQNTNLIIDINGYYAAPTGLTLSQGTAAAPSLSFSGDPGTGIFSSGGGTLNIATGGTNRLQLSNGNANLTGNLNVSANETIGGTLGVGMMPTTSRVEIAGQDGLSISGFEPFLTLKDTATNGRRSIIQGFSGGLTFFPETFIGGNAAMYLQDGTGRLGIGTSGPGYLLDVADRMRVRQAGANTAGMFFYQGGSDRGFVGMPNDNQVGFWGSTVGWGMTMDTTNGNISPGPDSGGFGLVKAMVYIDAYANPGTNNIITRCYNSRLSGSAATTVPCGFNPQYVAAGIYTVDFGFNLQTRFTSATPYNNHVSCPFGICPIITVTLKSTNNPNKIEIDLGYPNSTLQDNDVSLIVF